MVIVLLTPINKIEISSSHAGNTGSSPVGVTTYKIKENQAITLGFLLFFLLILACRFVVIRGKI